MKRSLFVFLSMFFGVGTAVAQYQINGDANQISCNCYQLTEDVPYSGGSVWNVNQIDLTNPFNYNFEVWLDCSEWGADGIAFVLQPVNITQGGGSSSLGYGGIAPSLVVEVDTWPNDVTMQDPQEDHIAIMQNGDSNHGSANNLAGPVVASSTQNNIEDCAWHTIQIIWQPSVNTLAVFFDGVFRTSYTGNIINTIFGGNSMVYWGWTGGTGSESADQRFCNSILPDYTLNSGAHCVGDAITFTDASLTSSGNISNYTWNFGDGTTGSGAPVTHTYNTAGTFNVNMTITTEGCTEDTIIPIVIDPTPVVNLGPDIDMCLGESVQLNSPNTLGSGTYAWSPSTALSNASAPSPTTSATSNTNYSLTFVSSNGCAGSDLVQVLVHPLPTVSAGNDVTACEGVPVVLQATGATNYQWSPATGLSNASVFNPSATPSATTTYTVTGTDANNCSNTDDITVTVLPSPSLDAGQNQNVCEGDVVQLSATGMGSFVWSPAVGLSSTSISDPTASPVTTTTYHVTLTDANNCSSVDSVIVDVDPIPEADFPDPTPVCNGNAVQFNDNSTGSIITYTWDFGDATTGTGTDPTHVYPDIGTYTVTLTTISANGCSDVATGTAEVIDGPIPVFTLNNGPDFCEQETLQITNNSYGPIVSYLWDFGDGNTSTAMIPTFAYDTYGIYTVSLTVGTADNCFNTSGEDISVNPLPQPEFSSTPACFGETTEFTEQATIPQGSVIAWDWSFGDGTGGANGQTASHTYNSQGAFTVQLVAESALGCVDTIEQQVFVNPTPVVNASANDVCLGGEVSFVNGTVPNDNTIASWEWDFGDGQTGSDVAPTHVYSNFGTYTVQLIATTDSSCVGVTDFEVQVYPYPIADFSNTPTEGCVPVGVRFTDETSLESGYSITGYQWDFGDGATSNDVSPSHSYTTPGIYDVTLIATSEGGCVDTLTVSSALSIYVTPNADFDYRPGQPTMLDPRIRFDNTTVNGIDYEWDFGDGNSSTEIDPVNNYPDQGDYVVTLIATNGICADTTVQLLHIDPVTFIYIPNAFTPNGNGLNDGFTAKGIGIEQFDMTIFDRWGNQLYYTARIDEPWNGIYKGAECPADSYVYRINIVDVKGESRKYFGNVTLVR